VEATVLWPGMEVLTDVRRANLPNKIFTGRVKPPGLDGRRFLFVREFSMSRKEKNHELREKDSR
jgi:hypothetical protein